MSKITPVGSRIIVAPLPKANFKTEAGIDITEELDRGKVIEVSEELKDLYKKGDVVMYSEGAGVAQYYKQQQCLWLNGEGQPRGDIWGTIENEKPIM